MQLRANYGIFNTAVKEFIKRLKFSYTLYNYFHKRELEHNVPLLKKYGLKKKYYSTLSHKDFAHLKEQLSPQEPKDTVLDLPKKEAFQALTSEFQEALLPWSQKGYAVLERFLSPEKVERVNAEVDRLNREGEANWRYRNKVMFAIHSSEFLNDLAGDKTLLTILELLVGQPVEVFQSINFLTASEQRTHSDSIHMTTFPKGNLVAVWIALEDITPENGPLHYFPGSHKLPYIMNEDFGNEGTSLTLGKKSYVDYEDTIEALIEEKGLKKETFLAKKGDVFIWHANLLHGGEPLLDKNATRKSMVLHYFGKDAICFHEVTQRPALKKKLKK